ncbi:MAG: sigma-54-dependent Fis family transcriptional regulator [Zoogloea sp.]|uniref:sigma-54-dependent Fis family transcriptional regulator n=1 Tax=Zoogloea sp. TaxID=49181 RepID=UPI0026094FD1|nr:sigma-54-dependent Fis family transcriptional regulator [Zoogloea sp.]MDD2987433.1 sigma-54-dependent Fis family transcriptional regulator [Zoogloea sp.]
MMQVPFSVEARAVSLQEARSLYFGRGELPEALLDQNVLRSWERCRQAGLDPARLEVGEPNVRGVAEARERNRTLISHAQPVLEHLSEQIRNSHSMVILADVRGMVLQSYGDADFLSRAEQVALHPGASWHEFERGTNAIGMALTERGAVNVFGSEHFFEGNAFLTCSASPIQDAQGRLMGVLDISSDYRAFQRHSLGLVKMSSRIIEKRLFESEFAHQGLLSFHSRPDHVGSLCEALLAISPDGDLLGADQAALELLGMRREDLPRRHYNMLFDVPLGTLIDRARRDPSSLIAISGRNGERFYARLRGNFGSLSANAPVLVDAKGERMASRVRQEAVAAATPVGAKPCLTLQSLSTGDERLQAAIDKGTRILGRDIPILIQGESGAGKEMFAKAFHNSGPRASGPFVALNCAAIPETLIESELFGYSGGAFTGARKEGAVGKIQQAHGGTLFLDEIGDMPLSLQARLLRVLQERCVTPLGTNKSIPVDITLVCATHRRLKEEVARGGFREDLYYRLNGLCINLPSLRERSDIDSLIDKLLREEAGPDRKVQVSHKVMEAFLNYRWPGNIRQLNNVIKVAIALLDDDEESIETWHLPDDIFEEIGEIAQPCTLPQAGRAPLQADAAAPARSVATAGMGRLEEIERDMIQRTLEAENGNISSAARRLGISRNTLYRKLGRF